MNYYRTEIEKIQKGNKIRYENKIRRLRKNRQTARKSVV